MRSLWFEHCLNTEYFVMIQFPWQHSKKHKNIEVIHECLTVILNPLKNVMIQQTSTVFKKKNTLYLINKQLIIYIKKLFYSDKSAKKKININPKYVIVIFSVFLFMFLKLSLCQHVPFYTSTKMQPRSPMDQEVWKCENNNYENYLQNIYYYY